MSDVLLSSISVREQKSKEEQSWDDRGCLFSYILARGSWSCAVAAPAQDPSWARGFVSILYYQELDFFSFKMILSLHLVHEKKPINF